MSIAQFCRALASLGLVLALTGTKVGPGQPPAKTVGLCQGCHGAHGQGTPAASIPRLAGQSADYLEKQLRDYASGKRDNPIMRNWAKQLNDSQRAELAAYYASLSNVPYAVEPASSAGAVATASLFARGHELAYQGDEVIRVQACGNCHGPDGNGAVLSAPYVAGQSAQYIAASLKAWKDGSRKNDDGKLMAPVARQLGDKDIDAVAVYFSSFAASLEN